MASTEGSKGGVVGAIMSEFGLKDKSKDEDEAGGCRVDHGVVCGLRQWWASATV